MSRLTKQEQLVLCFVLALLLTGWLVKAYRAAHPPAITGLEPQTQAAPVRSGTQSNNQ